MAESIPLVLKLQQGLLEEGSSVANLLRVAKVVATKLNLAVGAFIGEAESAAALLPDEIRERVSALLNELKREVTAKSAKRRQETSPLKAS